MAWVVTETSSPRIVVRARICLLAADGLPNRIIAQTLTTSRPTVAKWRKRFQEGGPEGLAEDAPHGPSPRALPAKKIKAIIRATLQTAPPDKTRWSTRTMARAMGVSNSTVSRIWDAHGLQPHRVERFQLPRDEGYIGGLTDVVGVYLNPPDKVIVLCVDERSWIQALELTRPGLPMKKARSGVRNYINRLFAALNVLEGKVIGSCYPRHRHAEFRKFLQQIDRATPRGLEIHMILDSRGTLNHPVLKTWLEHHPHFHRHFTPTSSSWLNLVEHWFGEITHQRIRRGAFGGIAHLLSDIKSFIRINSANPKPFIWTSLS